MVCAPLIALLVDLAKSWRWIVASAPLDRVTPASLVERAQRAGIGGPVGRVAGYAQG